MNTAPVVLFAYNRPCHVAKVIEALQKNELARDTDLICYADGAKSEQDAEAVRQVRAVLREISGFRSVRVIERPVNMGLADSIVQGVTEVVNTYGRVIVLEDDIVTSPFFLRYMNDALARYADEDRVMHVAAYMPSLGIMDAPESFFLRHTSCWGWATWKRAWRHFHRDSSRYLKTFSEDDIYRFNLDGNYNYWSQLQENHQKRIRTWCIYWYACVFNKRALCLHPRESLVENIGFDHSGVHCGKGSPWSLAMANNFVSQFPEMIEEYSIALSVYNKNEKFFYKQQPNVLKKCFSFFFHVIKNRSFLL